MNLTNGRSPDGDILKVREEGIGRALQAIANELLDLFRRSLWWGPVLQALEPLHVLVWDKLIPRRHQLRGFEEVASHV